MRWLAALVGRGRSWIVLGAAVAALAALFTLLPAAKAAEFPGTGLPASAESAKVDALLAQFPSADGSVGILVYDRADGGRLSAADTDAVTASASALADLSTTPQAVRPQIADDGTAALVAVPIEKPADPAAEADRIRDAASTGLSSDLRAQLTGPLGFQADTAGAFAGADLRLLLVTVAVVAVLLIVTYRSPVLWIVPLLVVGAADGVAGRLAGVAAEAAGLQVDPSITGILSVLVFGAGTDYALLLVSRYREELRRHEDRVEAMRLAVREAGSAISASGVTVVLALGTLLLATLTGNRVLGLACVVGIATALVFALVVLPAALVVCGRGVFWPFVPRFAGAHVASAKPGLFERVGRGVVRRPATVLIGALVVLGACAAGVGGVRVGLSQTDQLLGDPPSVQAQKVIERSFGSGLTAQTTILAPDAVADRVAQLASGTTGVASASATEQHDGLTRIAVQLDAEPQSDAAFATIQRLRTGIADAGGDEARSLVGGTDATALDVRTASERDLALIAPLILGIAFVVLLVLLRSLLAPVLLVLSVVVTFFASLGISDVLFTRVFGFPGLQDSVLLYAFLFLVALGIDYNIFLSTRAREELKSLPPAEAMVRALATTGPVITSAGVLLAAVFAVLGVLPVVALAQVGTVVCIGVLLDTVVVRTLVVPALAVLMGRAFWWPTKTLAR